MHHQLVWCHSACSRHLCCNYCYWICRAMWVIILYSTLNMFSPSAGGHVLFSMLICPSISHQDFSETCGWIFVNVLKSKLWLGLWKFHSDLWRFMHETNSGGDYIELVILSWMLVKINLPVIIFATMALMTNKGRRGQPSRVRSSRDRDHCKREWICCSWEPINASAAYGLLSHYTL